MNILYSKHTNLHRPIDNHLESPERLQKAIDLFTNNEPYISLIDSPVMKPYNNVLSLIRKAQGETVMSTFVVPKIVTCASCKKEYKHKNNICIYCNESNYIWMHNFDTYVCKDSLIAVVESVSILMSAIDNIINKNMKVQYCIIRPPGHHHSVEAEGFCLVNNVWVATEYAIESGFSKPMVIDYDSHHFNGFQELVHKCTYKNRFGVSIHGWSDKVNVYPGTGSAESSNDNILNIPLVINKKSDRVKYDDGYVLSLFIEKVIPWIKRHNPDIIFVSNGMDSHKDDPIGYSYLTHLFYARVADMLLKFGVPIVYVQEGGYNPKAVLECSTAIVDTIIANI